MKLLYAMLKWRYRAQAIAYQSAPAQEALLLSLLEKNRNAAYGKTYGFSSIRSEKAYREQVPVVRFDDIAPWVERIRQGETGVLTEEPVLLFEPTGGSSGVRKWIPYTKTLQTQFRQSVEAWLYDIYTEYPGVDQGKAYWMITPPFTEEDTAETDVPVGFEDDAAYLGSWGQKLMNRMMVQPLITPGMDTETFYTVTVRALAAEKNLRLLSVWNPSLLLNLLGFLQKQSDTVKKTLSKSRAEALERAVQTENWQLLWPELRLLSCWADASAADDAKELAACLPFATMQPKGLLSTECMVSFPTRQSLAHGGMLPAFRSTYMEFFTEDRFFCLQEIEEGVEYDVIVTTGGGLYRYDTGDRIRVTGRLGSVPLLRFTGRTGTVDLVGEKLTPGFVETVFSDLTGFYLLMPMEKGYVLCTDTAIRPQEAETRLLTSHHYALARRMGQLKPVRVFRITGDAKQQYFEQCQRHGQRLGDIKPVRLTARTDFVFTGEYHD